MRLWACAELRATGPLGLPSRAGELLAGRTVLERTVERLRRLKDIQGVAVLVEPGGAEQARRWLGSAQARVLEVLGPDSPRRQALRRARKWSRDSWRGGIRQTMELDASGDFASLAAAARELSAEALLVALPESPLADAEILAGLVRHAAPEGRPVMPSALCQAPAGFAGFFAVAGWLESMAAAGRTYGSLLAREPGRIAQPLAHRADCYVGPTAVRRCEFRAAADSARSAELLSELLRRAPGAGGLGPGGEEAARLVAGDPALYAGRFPRLVEVELTTAGGVPFKDTPAALDVPERRMSARLFEKLLDDLRGGDDVLLTLGGPGDPLAHPEVFDLLRLARAKGVYGLHLDTPGTLLDEACAGRLLECDLDVVSVRLGAARAETYQALTGRGDFEALAANVERLAALRKQSGREWPFVAVEAEKRVEVEPELLEFFDRWEEKSDWPVIRPFSDYAGQLPDRAALHLTLASRVPCRRLLKELCVRAGGEVPVCRMDFRCAEPAGSVERRSVEELWTSGRIAGLRGQQHAGRLDGFRLCPACRDWDNT